MASTYQDLNIHIVFATKGRAPMIEESWRRDFHAYIGGTAKGLGTTPYVIGGVSDHVHLLLGFRTTHCIADVVREIKKASSIWAHERLHCFAWQTGYGAFTVGHGEMLKVIEYIENQEKHHCNHSSSDELRALLIEHGVDYEERFFE